MFPDRWTRGFIADPLTFLDQERWKDTPPAGEAKALAKGEVRLVCIAFAFALTYPGPIFEDERYWPASFMVCCTFALLPLLITAWIDCRLSGNRWRVPACGFAGFGMATALHYMITHEGGVEADMQKYYDHWFSVGLVWGLPAAVCSWLAGQKQNGEVQ